MLASGIPPALRDDLLRFPILVQHLPRDRERMGLREVQMAGRLRLTLRQYRALEAGELHITNDLYAAAGGVED